MIHHKDMDQSQHAAVAQAMMRYLTEPQSSASGYSGSDDVDMLLAPIIVGEIRRSRSGAPWVCFHDPDQKLKRWFRYMDVPPGDDYAGGQLVHDADGRPLGNSTGPLILHQIRGEWIAQTINTGWNFENEIHWA